MAWWFQLKNCKSHVIQQTEDHNSIWEKAIFYHPAGFNFLLRVAAPGSNRNLLSGIIDKRPGFTYMYPLVYGENTGLVFFLH